MVSRLSVVKCVVVKGLKIFGCESVGVSSVFCLESIK